MSKRKPSQQNASVNQLSIEQFAHLSDDDVAALSKGAKFLFNSEHDNKNEAPIPLNRKKPQQR